MGRTGRCVVLLLLGVLAALARDAAANISECTWQVGDESSYCNIFTTEMVCCETATDHDPGESSPRLLNVTLYNETLDMSVYLPLQTTVLLVLVQDGSDGMVCREVHFSYISLLNKGATVTITNLRGSPESRDNVTVLTGRPGCGETIRPGLSEETSKCPHNLSYSFQGYPSNTYRFVPLLEESEVNMTVTLYNSSLCRISCEFSVHNNCAHDTREPVQLQSGMEHIFENISTGYLCLQIEFGVCYFHTRTVYFTESTGKAQPIQIPPETSNVPLIVTAIFILILSVAVISAIRYAVLRSGTPRLKLERDRETTPDSGELMLRPCPTVLLLYSLDTDQFGAVMDAFKTLLARAFHATVLDPLDQAQIEEVALNRSGWVLQHLNSPDTKVVIVISEGAIMRQNALLNNRLLHLSHPHSLDNIFSYALQYLHENPQLSRDYQRVYTVRFQELVSSSRTLPLIVPLKSFVLLEHIGDLGREIQGSPHHAPLPLNELKELHRTEVDDLERAISEMKKFTEANPQNLNKLYSLVTV